MNRVSRHPAIEAAIAVIARRRVALGFLFGAGALWLAAPTWRTLAIGVPIASAGEAIRFWAAGHLRKSQEVTASGPYRWCAHPLYVGSSVMGLGVVIAAASIPVAVLAIAYLGASLTAAVKNEEAFLASAFGEGYRAYRRGQANGEAARRPFSFAQAMANHEQRALVGLLLAIVLLALKAASNV